MITALLAISTALTLLDISQIECCGGIIGVHPIGSSSDTSKGSWSPLFEPTTESTQERNGTQNNGKGWPLERAKFNHPIQSPVDIITSKIVTMDLPVLYMVEPLHPNAKAKLFNSGHTVYVYIMVAPSFQPHLKGGPLREKFIFEQMHFHWGFEAIWGSEHFIDGESFAVEIHLVHFNSKYGNFVNAATKPDGLAVLTIFAEADDDDNELLDPLYEQLSNIVQLNSSVEVSSTAAMQWAASALNLNHEYYTYPGSLTTEPYSENVIFILLPKTITMSTKQLNAFRKIHSEHHGKILDNMRQLQPLHNRPIVRSTSLARTSCDWKT